MSTTTLDVNVPTMTTQQLLNDVPAPFYISGTVTDADGNPAERTIRLYSRTSGELTDSMMSDSVTGEFEFMDIGENEFYVVAVADGAEEPDLIHRVMSGSDD